MLTGIITASLIQIVSTPTQRFNIGQGGSVYSVGSYNQLVALFFFLSGTQKVRLAPNGTNLIKYGIELFFVSNHKPA